MIQYLKVGQIINTHGVNGELKIYPLTDDIKRFKRLKHVFLKSDSDYLKYDVLSVKFINELVIIKLSGIDDMNKAVELKKEYLYIDRENAIKLPKDSYFITDLIGMDVLTEEGTMIGSIASVFSTGSNDVYEIKDSTGKTILIPAIKDVVKRVEIDNKKMYINLLEGLI